MKERKGEKKEQTMSGITFDQLVGRFEYRIRDFSY
jgi:hypothetical protein